jgi:hypothetical protein
MGADTVHEAGLHAFFVFEIEMIRIVKVAKG